MSVLAKDRSGILRQEFDSERVLLVESEGGPALVVT